MLKKVTAWLHSRNDYEICAMLIVLIVGSSAVVAIMVTWSKVGDI